MAERVKTLPLLDCSCLALVRRLGDANEEENGKEDVAVMKRRFPRHQIMRKFHEQMELKEERDWMRGYQ